MPQEQSREYTLVDPTTQPVAAAFGGAPRLASLAGARIGLIDDSKRNADVLLEELVEALRSRYEIGNVQWHRKPSASRPADPAAMRELAQHCDAIVIAVGD
jgi:hypothetical protein